MDRTNFGSLELLAESSSDTSQTSGVLSGFLGSAGLQPGLKALLCAVLDSPSAMFVALDKEFSLFYNNSCRTTLGFTDTDLLGARADVVFRKTWPALEDEFIKVYSGTSAVLRDVAVFREKSGKTEQRYFTFFLSPVREEGKIKGVMGIVEASGTVPFARNSKKTQVSAEDKNRYYQLVNGLNAAVYTCDRNGHIIMYNKAAVNLWGREPEIGKDMWCGSWKIYRPDGTALPLENCPMAVALKEGRSVKGEEIIIERPDGIRRHVLPHPEPLFDASGNIIEAVNMLLDITEIRCYQEALSESEERFRTMSNQVPIIIWMFDAGGKAVYLNEKWTEYTGCPAERGLGSLWTDFMHPEEKEEILSRWESAFVRRENYSDKFRYRNASGEYCIMSVSCSVRRNGKGEFAGYVGVLYNITLLENTRALLEKLVEERTRNLREANADLERSNHELEQYAYIASHDLQEPLRKIRTFSDRLFSRYGNLLDDDARLNLSKINDSAKRMTELINGLLNFSRLTKRGETFVQTDLNDIFEHIRNDLELLIAQKNALINQCALPVIEAIPLQMNQLFYNILSNSLKFSSEKEQPVISMSSRLLKTSEVKKYPELNPAVKYYEIIFKDNGIGFDQKYAEQIFVIFKRLNKPVAYEGSGLGLALCRRVVNNHQGKIYARGNENAGSSFHIVLPAIQPADNPQV
jgi:PAS domain S-box-containing protein